MKKKSIKDIAQELGLSKTTVSFVLNNKGDEKNISKKTQEKILAYVREVNYQPNQIAKSLKKGTTHTIGYLVPDISNPFYAKIGRLIEDVLADKGYHLLIGSTDEKQEKEDALLNMFVNRQVDGLILASTFENLGMLKTLSAQRFPMVFFDREHPDFIGNYILVENKNAMKEAVNTAINKGAKKIGLLSITPNIYSLKLRIDGYRESLVENQLNVDEDLMRIVDNSRIKESTQEELNYLMDKDVDAVVFTNNQITALALWAMNINHKDKIDSVRFVSFDNLDLFDYSNPKVNSIAQPIDSIANHLVDILHEVMQSTERVSKRIVLEPKLIERL
ncbi:LacI family DNA-binding transcriptional regulator [Marinifilum caeruleilacunae]|uniref:LacI family transcriptional regulator n=1 Tax=Marinifilum caeruleilacunae TaxID=2499076 RepID=A0ABX1WXB8_9BACT|nr:LacI family DNA-binding transcriptional regulator [Marinifilum caeruleilacunae]NOU60778.1 LacI family transcriptional regulator [Marinifilum caeruleilacunae]